MQQQSINIFPINRDYKNTEDTFFETMRSFALRAEKISEMPVENMAQHIAACKALSKLSDDMQAFFNSLTEGHQSASAGTGFRPGGFHLESAEAATA